MDRHLSVLPGAEARLYITAGLLHPPTRPCARLATWPIPESPSWPMCRHASRRILGVDQSIGIAVLAATEVKMSSVPVIALSVIALVALALVAVVGALALLAGVIIVVARKQRQNAAPAVAREA